MLRMVKWCCAETDVKPGWLVTGDGIRLRVLRGAEDRGVTVQSIGCSLLLEFLTRAKSKLRSTL